MSDNWFEPYLYALPLRSRLLELGCGPGEDCTALTALGFEVVASDFLASQLKQARSLIGTRALVQLDHRHPLPFVDHAFGGVIASLSLHYFPRDVIAAVFAEIHRVPRPDGVLLFRVNATDDVEYGARDGVEIEPNVRRYETADLYGDLKRFFEEHDVREMLGSAFTVESLRHMPIDRFRRPKQVWECLARSIAVPTGR